MVPSLLSSLEIYSDNLAFYFLQVLFFKKSKREIQFCANYKKLNTIINKIVI